MNGVTFTDFETGISQVAEAAVVINATGIFSDAIRLMDDAKAARAVQPSQGVHLVFDRSFLQGDSAIMVPHTDDGRVLFVIPWHDKVLVGTTDTPMQPPEIEPCALQEEVGFILRNAARYLARDPHEKDILSIFAGQRPLVRKPGKDGVRHQGDLPQSRGARLGCRARHTGRRQVDHLPEDGAGRRRSCRHAGRSPSQAMHHRTSPTFGWRSRNAAPLPDWLSVYGSDEEAIRDLIASHTELAGKMHPRLLYPLATVVWGAGHEQARTLEDILSRPTRALLLDARAAIEAAPTVAALLSKELGRDKVWEAEQVREFTQLAGGYLHQPAP